MRKSFKYGTIGYSGAKPGDSVRFVEAPKPGETGAILVPRGPHEVNALLVKVTGTLGYAEITPRLSSPVAAGEAGTATGVRISIPVSAGGSLKIS